MRRFKGMACVFGIWLGIVIFLIVSLWAMERVSEVVYYTAYVRGATQRLAKEELVGIPNPQLEAYLERLIDELHTGHGENGVILLMESDYQNCVLELKQLWEPFQQGIEELREAGESADFYRLSEDYFYVCDRAYIAAANCLNNCLMLTFILVVLLAVTAAVYLIIAERRRKMECEEVFYTDNLTGIGNKEAFHVRAAALLKRNPRQKYALVHLDVNNFKYINEVYGYEKGDQLLKAVAKALAAIYQEGETCARLYADHFVILSKYAANLTTVIHDTVTEQVKKQVDLDISDSLSFSFGVYVIPENQEFINSMVDKAEFSSKEAKLQKNTDTIFYDDTIRKQVQRESFFTGRMQYALDHGEFKVYLQPKFRISTDEIIGAEALVRWVSPEIGLIPPNDFIPLFERNGFIVQLDSYILEMVCRHLRQWLDTNTEETVPIAVNFSRVSVYRNDFIKDFIKTVEHFQIPPNYLEVEITETVLGINPSSILQILLDLKNKGFPIAMDDFGTGYSSLNFLRNLPVDVLKLDKDFLVEGCEGSRTREVIRCVVELGQVLHAQIVCEGVETKEQLEFLKEIGCDVAQGFYYEKPIPLDEFELKYANRMTC